MDITNIRKKLHELVDELEDKKAEAFYTLLTDTLDTDAERKRLVQAEREKHFRGEGRSYSWDEVKQMAITSEKRHGI
jgi:hypothetical protein